MIQEASSPTTPNTRNVTEDIMSKYSSQIGGDSRGAATGLVSGASRRRMRNLRMPLRDGMFSASRIDNQISQSNANESMEMDEENGRERKRTARR